MISCCLSGSGWGGPDVYRADVIRARKPWRCEECGGPIDPGQRYERATGMFDGSWFTVRTCIVCVRVRDDHDCGDGFVHGELWEQLAECYGYEVTSESVDFDDDEDPMGPPPDWSGGREVKL